MEFKNCFITGLPFDKSVIFHSIDFNGYKYEFKVVGRVLITDTAKIMLDRNPNFNRTLLAGLCRTAFELKKEPPLIDSNLLNDLESSYDYPKTFNEKSLHLLNLLYEMGGKENKKFVLDSTNDYPLAFASSQEEFSRIIEYLKKNEFIEWERNFNAEDGSITVFINVEFTKKGIDYVDKSHLTLFGLFNQNIKTGDPTIDNKLLHAHNLFFKENSSIDDKRSACETLSYVLEPLRKKLIIYFIDKDVDTFFRIVNEFDIRHNKAQTNKIIYVEQLEWTYYTLLNTILTYIKLSKRFK